MTKPIVAYKGFNKDWTCRGFQYEIGQTYEHDGEVKACSSGFHACTHPLDVFGYYSPGASRFALVELAGEQASEAGDSKVAAAQITIKAELHISEMVEAAVKHVFDAAKWLKKSGTTGDLGAASATCDWGAASATGDWGAASATGNRGAASATGDWGAASATGDWGAAMASGYEGKASGKPGNALFLCERNDEMEITAVWAGIVGSDGIEPDTFYMLRDGKPVETQS